MNIRARSYWLFLVALTAATIMAFGLADTAVIGQTRSSATNRLANANS